MTPQVKLLVVLVGLAVFGLLALVGSARKSARSAAKAAREGTHAVSLFGRVLMVGGLIAGVQWLVIRFAHSPMLLGAALVVPALLASATLVRSLTVTAFGGRR